MIIAVGYTPTPLGQAVLLAGIEEAQTRGGSLVVLNTSRGDAISDPGYAQPADLLADAELHPGLRAGGANPLEVCRLGVARVADGITTRGVEDNQGTASGLRLLDAGQQRGLSEGRRGVANGDDHLWVPPASVGCLVAASVRDPTTRRLISG